MGGDQRVPSVVRRARIHKSVKIVPNGAFKDRWRLISVEFHDGVEIIEEDAFNWCLSLRGPIKLLGIKIIKEGAFFSCWGLTGVEFGNQLETIERHAFSFCHSIRTITMPHVRTIGKEAFCNCNQLTDLKLPEALETSDEGVFRDCVSLTRITLPLKENLITYDVFNGCTELTTVNLFEGIHETVASLPLERWINEMTGEINRINEVLPNTDYLQTTQVIRGWVRSVTHQLNHYKAEHQKVLKEATTLLELALWKANLDENEGGVVEKEGVRTTRGQRKRARKEISITSGASIVIKNVVPFLELK